jgi:hypothetical protein
MHQDSAASNFNSEISSYDLCLLLGFTYIIGLSMAYKVLKTKDDMALAVIATASFCT